MQKKPRFFVLGISFALLSCLVILVAFWYFSAPQPSQIISPLTIPRNLPLEKYTIENLSQRVYEPSEIVFDKAVATDSGYTSYLFHFFSDGKKVTGLAHVPVTAERKKFPVVVQFRGFVPKDMFRPGVGTSHSAEVFAKNGFISLAPDFLGYGGSDMPGKVTAFEERFETYTTALNLLSSVLTLPQWDGKNIFIHGHSNGGQIALTVATILGEKGFPTTLWAPVTKPFPYNVLYYTDEFDDEGKALRKELANLEKEYDVYLYSFLRYLSRIAVPIQLHQGLADEAVPYMWSTNFVKKLQSLGKSITYFTYEGMDHNMSGGWDTVVSRDIQFFNRYKK